MNGSRARSNVARTFEFLAPRLPNEGGYLLINDSSDTRPTIRFCIPILIVLWEMQNMHAGSPYLALIERMLGINPSMAQLHIRTVCTSAHSFNK